MAKQEVHSCSSTFEPLCSVVAMASVGGGGFRGVVNLTPELGPLAVARDGENVMVSDMEEPVQEIAAKGSRGKITSSSLSGVGEAVALGRTECGGRQHASWGFTKRSGGVKGNGP